HRDREVVEDRPVPPGDHEVVGRLVREADLTADLVHDDRFATVGDAQADRRTGIVTRLAAVAAVAVLLLPRGHVVAGGSVSVRSARLEQLVERLAVAVGALALADRALVPVELEPAQGVEDLLDVLRGRALAVGVLDAEHHLSPTAAREEPV